MNHRRTTVGLTALLASLALAACSSGPATTPAASGSAKASTSAPATAKESKKLTVVTHDSFALSQPLLDKFKADTGYEVTMVAPGDAGTMVNQLVLTKSSPLGDVVYGIDNTFAGRALKEDVVAEYAAPGLPAADAAGLKADDSKRLSPIDFGDVCVNADTAWFEKNGKSLPKTLDDLTKPEYKNLLVVPNAATSSPGLAFLTATVGAKGEPGWKDYWKALKANGVLVAKDWTETYSVQFTAGGGNGPRPLALSYSSSPAFTVKDGTSSTVALLDTCFRQVEYAGVVKGAQNEVGARKFIDFLLTPEVQADIPGQMYMYPAVSATELPKDWKDFAPLADDPHQVPAADIAAKREGWIRDWTTTVIG